MHVICSGWTEKHQTYFNKWVTQLIQNRRTHIPHDDIIDLCYRQKIYFRTQRKHSQKKTFKK